MKRPVLQVCLILVLPFLCLLAQKNDGIARKEATVSDGNARFTVLTPRVVRMEYSPSRKFEDRPTLTFIQCNIPTPSYSVRSDGGWLEIRTEVLRIRYKIGTGPFDGSNLSVHFKTGDMEGDWIPGKVNKGDLRGTVRTLDGTDGDLFIRDSTKVQLEPGVISRDGWVLIDDSRTPVFDSSEWPWVSARPENNQQDLYFFAYGYNYRGALKDFIAIAGRIALPPRFVFGYWYSRWRASSESELRDLIGTFESLNVPLDVLVIDMDWHLTNLPEFFDGGTRKKDQAGESSGWTGFTWNRSYFPNPGEFLSWTRSKGLKTSLNLHPASGIQPHEEQYEPMALAMGIDPKTKRYVQFDIVDKKFAQKYFDIVLHPLEKLGIDFWWLDWQQWNTTTIPGVNPTFYLNYVHYTDMERQKKVRPLIYHRWGGLGNHRYQIGFSGDTKISWKSLEFQPYFTATAANVGFGYWGNDIGGFFGEPNTPEQFTRWFQFGIFSPIVKTHATSRNFSILRKLWEYPPETFLHLRDLVRLRYALIPYIYTAARSAYDDGVSICHPLYYDFPKREESYRFPNAYMFGNDMLVHPVTRPMGKDSLFVVQETWLPPGEWFEMSSGVLLKGDRIVQRAFGLEGIPVYIKAGSIIPMQPSMMHTGEKPVDPLILTFYPGTKGTAQVYEDEGNSDSFKNAQCTLTEVRFNAGGNVLTAVIDPVKGRFPGMLRVRGYQLRFPNTYPPERVLVDGTELAYSTKPSQKGWTYDGSDLSTIVSVPPLPVTRRKEIRVEFPSVRSDFLAGKKRQFDVMYRFSKYLSDIRSFRKQDVWNDAKYSSDLVLSTAQAGLRITRNPASIQDELGHFDAGWQRITNMLEQLTKDHPAYSPYLELMKTCGEE